MNIDEFCQEYGLEKNEAGNYVYISENRASKIDLGLILEELKSSILEELEDIEKVKDMTILSDYVRNVFSEALDKFTADKLSKLIGKCVVFDPEVLMIANFCKKGYTNKQIADIMKTYEMDISRKKKKYKSLYPQLFEND